MKGVELRFKVNKNQNHFKPCFESSSKHTRLPCTCDLFALHVQLLCLARTACCTCHRSSPPWRIRLINGDNSRPVQHHIFISVVFPGRDLRFNNISIIEDGDLAELRHLTTLWVFLSTPRSLFFFLGDVHASCTLAMFLSSKFIHFHRFLSGNNIHTIEAEAFSGLSSLKYL